MSRTNTPREANPLAQFADPAEAFKNPLQLSFIRVLVEAVGRIAATMISRDTAAPHFILLSPNGTAYRITVANDGSLVSENARGA